MRYGLIPIQMQKKNIGCGAWYQTSTRGDKSFPFFYAQKFGRLKTILYICTSNDAKL